MLGLIAAVTLAGWLHAETTAFKRPSQLEHVIGNARVIGLGETEHGTKEFFAFRNRFVEHAVTSLGVTAIAAESGYNESIPADDYINGKAPLTPAAVAGVFSWSYPQGYRQNEALLQWLHDYNARPTTKRKIHFYGLDLTGGRSGAFSDARASIDYALAYVAGVDPSGAASYHAQLDSVMPKFSTAAYTTLTAEQQTALTATLDDLIALFERRAVAWSAKTTPESFQRAYHSAVIARQLNENFRSAQAESNPQAQREPAMAQNLQWVLRQNAGRVLLYEANWHISKGPMSSDRWGTALGEYLHQMLGADYVAIGTAFGTKPATADDPAEQPDPTSLAAALAQSCAAPCLLDLDSRKPLPADIATWFATMQHIESGRVDIMDLRSSFDAMIYFPTIHSAALL